MKKVTSDIKKEWLSLRDKNNSLEMLSKINELPLTSIKVLEIIESQLRSQNEKGLEKYGTTIDEARNCDYKWNVMVIEELVDGIQYVVKENLRLKEENKKIKVSNGKMFKNMLNNKFGKDVEKEYDMNDFIDVVNDLTNRTQTALQANHIRNCMEDYIETVVGGRVKAFKRLEEFGKRGGCV